MSPEDKQKAYDLMSALLTKKYPEFPAIHPAKVKIALPDLYNLLAREKVIDSAEISFNEFVQAANYGWKKANEEDIFEQLKAMNKEKE